MPFAAIFGAIGRAAAGAARAVGTAARAVGAGARKMASAARTSVSRSSTAAQRKQAARDFVRSGRETYNAAKDLSPQKILDRSRKDIMEEAAANSRDMRYEAINNAELRDAIREGRTDSYMGNNAYSKEKAFYAATEDIWRGVDRTDPNAINDAIKAYYGVDTIEEAYRIVEQANEDAFRAIDSRYENLKSTDFADMSEDEREQYEEFYRDYLSRLNQERPVRAA